MKIKGKGIVRMEQITCRALVLISVFAFAMCLVMEYFFPLWINDYHCKLIHLDFLKNVMLGISGSAFVSFVCIIFPYSKKKSDFSKKMLSLIKPIYLCYLDIHGMVETVNGFERKIKRDDANTYGFEKKLYEVSQSLQDKIDFFVIEYLNSEWSSREISNLIDLLHEEVATNIKTIKGVVSSVFPLEFRNKPLETPSEIKKDVRLKRAEKDIYKMLLEEMDKRLEIKKLKKFFKPFKFNLANIYLKDFSESFLQFVENMENKKWEQEKDFNIISLNFRVLDIISKHSYKYAVEYEELKSILKKVPENVKNNNITIIKEFYRALQEDRMSDAKKIIEELKSEYTP